MKIKLIGVAIATSFFMAGCTVATQDTALGEQDIKVALNQDTRAQVSGKNSASASLYGAELYSTDRVLFGKFVIRMKMVSEPGVVSSFFTYDNESWAGEGRPWREVDFETIGSQPNILQTNLITGTSDKRVHSEKTALIADIESYKTYTLEWKPASIVWKVDGEVVRSELATESQQTKEMADTPQTYRSNIWISEVIDWVGQFDETHLPRYQVIDWIEYHEYKADDTFTLAWRDDFNKFDSKRWGKGNWSFDTNIVTFSPDNLKVIEGELVLALTLDKKGIDIEHYKQSK